VVLEAASGATDSRGNATDGVARGEAEVLYDTVTNAVVARAETTIEAVRLSDQLSLNGVHSVAIARKTSAGEVERSSTFDVAALTIAGQRVALTKSELADPTGVLSQLLGGLAAQGTVIEPFPSTDTDDGVISAGVRITMTVAPPPSLASGLNEVIVTYTVGGNAASVANRAFGQSPSIDLTATPSGASTGSAISPANAIPVSAGAGSTAAASGDGASSQTRSPSTPIVAVSPAISIASFYPVLIVAAVALFALIEVFRRRGVIDP
jgi:hypothetical protein